MLPGFELRNRFIESLPVFLSVGIHQVDQVKEDDARMRRGARVPVGERESVRRSGLAVTGLEESENGFGLVLIGDLKIVRRQIADRLAVRVNRFRRKPHKPPRRGSLRQQSARGQRECEKNSAHKRLGSLSYFLQTKNRCPCGSPRSGGRRHAWLYWAVPR